MLGGKGVVLSFTKDPNVFWYRELDRRRKSVISVYKRDHIVIYAGRVVIYTGRKAVSNVNRKTSNPSVSTGAKPLSNSELIEEEPR